MKKLEIISVNISEKKGIVKAPVEQTILNKTGIQGDAHAGHWHRQVSLLSQESIEKAEKQANAKFPPGTFAENLTTRGIEVHKTAPLDRFVNDEVEMEVTQIGKKCHTGCAIGKQIGNCIMPLEGIFCKVIKGGIVKAGSTFDFVPYILKTKIITLSDRASKGVYKDLSGPKIKELLEKQLQEKNRHFSIENTILPDHKEQLEKTIQKAVEEKTDVIFTTGGTGIGPHDITPDVIKPMLDKEITGIMELIRVKYGMKNPNAILSRSVAGVIGKTLVYVLPGSVKAINEYMAEILPTLEHSLRMLHGSDAH
ncbi:molybdenum cofactor synthesis protein [Maribellus comscasis]|uniref:Molybdenum cofactor synthesis protein n=1 Tax=Maribellus comscasis TaxID=2681766 RepID=A0A6I6JNI5_9BACT|nr:MOSC domain-containing protein [Maribellus comscasis]QGY44516.1 molybdenum cofactor synthesis protein [Maribellus comscasis]